MAKLIPAGTVDRVIRDHLKAKGCALCGIMKKQENGRGHHSETLDKPWTRGASCGYVAAVVPVYSG